jgi:hypothetical protein
MKLLYQACQSALIRCYLDTSMPKPVKAQTNSPERFIFPGLVSPGQVFWNCTNQDRTQSQNTYNEISIQRSRHAHVYLEVQFDVDL